MSDNSPTVAKPGRNFLGPVAWLLGRQYKVTLKWILLYSAFGSKIDPRDWMQARAFPSAVASSETTEPQPCAGAWQTTDGEFWFDYLSDTGDGMRATYSIAYLCLSDLWIKDPRGEMPATTEDASVGFKQTASKQMLLPRGQFLFVGGDTTYHMSDYANLVTRFQFPFQWAYEDLQEAGRLRDEARRPLFAIPGNHDYYDMLDGFRRQFRHPINSEDKHYAEDDRNAPQLMLPGFRRCQEASYVALQLPFGWWLWGLDTEVGKLDARQRKFFTELNNGQTPEKLIVATCAPTTAFGRYADVRDEKSAESFYQLGLAQPFLDGAPARNLTADTPDTNGDQAKNAPPRVLKLPEGQCRLDLSGDIHMYARYWGPQAAGASPRSGSRAPRPSATNYASVVSGIGGAFLHPTQTYKDEIQEQALYPSEREARDEVAGRIFKFWILMNGGSVWLVGFVLAFLVYFGATIPRSSRQAFNLVPLWQRLGISQPERIQPTVLLPPDKVVAPVAGEGSTATTTTRAATAAATAATDVPAQSSFAAQSRNANTQTPFIVWRALGFGTWTPPAPEGSSVVPCTADATRYFWGPCRISPPLDYRLGITILTLTLLAAVAAFALRGRLFKLDAKLQAVASERLQLDSKKFVNPNILLWAFVVLTTALVVAGMLTIRPYREYIAPFGHSLLVLYSLLWAVAAVVLARRYSDWLSKQASRRTVRRRDWILPWTLSVLAVVFPTLGLWLFGKFNLVPYLVSDIVFVLVIGLGILFIVFPMAVLKGGENLGAAGKAGMFFVGLWHALLQLAVPFLFVRRGTFLTWAAAAVLILVFIYVGELLLRRNSRAGLVIAWIAHGTLMLALPFITSRPYVRLSPPFYSEAWTGWAGLVPSILAGIFGAVLVCVWFGWYLAVALAFNGHNNEAGGAARIERFKEFIRIRLTERDLTAYVIAVDDPKDDGKDLTPRIVDVFRLEAKAKT
ncbi:MAG TPA: DMT family transporter [Pyrinomonadaceae bacterium]|nr:DMT family transporter [Pyrinomonadaceae bacterium]